MLQIPKGQTTDAERAILRKLRVWIAALAAACLVAGIGVGAMLSRTRTVALDDPAPASAAQIARAPEALSASFAEIARRVEPAVVNIDTVSAAPPQTAGGRSARIDHSSFGIAPWDVDAVRAELEKRELTMSIDTSSAQWPRYAIYSPSRFSSIFS